MSQRTLDQRMLGVGTALTDHTITATDVISFADVGASNAIKRDTVQGVLDLAGGGGLVLIKRTVASTASTVEFVHGTSDVVIDNTYDVYMVHILDVNPSTSLHHRVRITHDAGSNWEDDSTDYEATIFGTHQTGGTAAHHLNGGSYLQLTNASISKTNAVGGMSCIFYMFHPSNTDSPKFFQWDSATADNTPTFNRSMGAGIYDGATTAINGIQFLQDTGTTSGTYSLYGMVIS